MSVDWVRVGLDLLGMVLLLGALCWAKGERE